MIDLSLSALPMLGSVNVAPTQDAGQLRNVVTGWQKSVVGQLGFVRELVPTMIGWDKPTVQRNLRDNCRCDGSSHPLDLVGVLPGIEGDNLILDVIVYRHHPEGARAAQMGFWWDTNQPSGPLRTRLSDGGLRVIETLGTIDQLFN